MNSLVTLLSRKRVKVERGVTGGLNVHKNENFFGSDFEFCTISLLVLLKYLKILKKKNFDWAINGGDTIVPLSLRRRKRKSQRRRRSRTNRLIDPFQRGVGGRDR